MAFPTVPTVAAGRVLTANQLDTLATRTFPDLSGLTKASGDLLIAIVVAYQTSTGTNAAFSGWTGGFTEFHDSATSATLAMGAAYKWSTGSETGTFAVTQAGTITGDASMILLSIPGAHATTPPEAGGRASGTTAAADPAAFDPAGWGVEDTLWISVVGSGMTSGTGSWTGTGTTPPTNFTDWVDTAAADTSTIGDCEAAVSFRQDTVASEDVGTAGVDTSNARNGAFVIAVRPVPAVAAVPTDVRVSFPSPSTDLTGSQEFRALVRRKEASAPAADPTVAIELWESGAKVADVVTGVPVTSTAGQVASGTWLASALAAVSGANVECRVASAGSSGGTVEIGAIEWNLARVADTGVSVAASATQANAGAGVVTVAGTTEITAAPTRANAVAGTTTITTTATVTAFPSGTQAGAGAAAPTGTATQATSPTGSEALPGAQALTGAGTVPTAPTGADGLPGTTTSVATQIVSSSPSGAGGRAGTVTATGTASLTTSPTGTDGLASSTALTAAATVTTAATGAGARAGTVTAAATTLQAVLPSRAGGGAGIVTPSGTTALATSPTGSIAGAGIATVSGAASVTTTPSGSLGGAGTVTAAATTLQAGTPAGARGGAGAATSSGASVSTATPAGANAGAGTASVTGTASTTAPTSGGRGGAGSATTTQTVLQTAIPAGAAALGRLATLTATATLTALAAGAGGYGGSAGSSGTATTPAIPGRVGGLGGTATASPVTFALPGRAYAGPGGQDVSQALISPGEMVSVGRVFAGLAAVPRDPAAAMTPVAYSAPTMTGVLSG